MPPRNPRRRNIERAAVVDRSGHRLLLLGRRLVAVPLLFERALRQEVLAPRREPEAEHEEPDAEEDAFPLRLAADPENRAVGTETGEAESEDQPDQRFRSARVLREGLEVRIVERRERLRGLIHVPVGAAGAVSAVAACPSVASVLPAPPLAETSVTSWSLMTATCRRASKPRASDRRHRSEER